MIGYGDGWRTPCGPVRKNQGQSNLSKIRDVRERWRESRTAGAPSCVTAFLSKNDVLRPFEGHEKYRRRRREIVLPNKTHSKDKFTRKRTEKCTLTTLTSMIISAQQLEAAASKNRRVKVKVLGEVLGRRAAGATS
ncbi:hypothetical protein EVAR_68059_1 [Eumeta japonica]|uniref:Uncharacterized protein n=1 Tax=Eumeta variegata TaxID=151549 RepID=A0A4C1ZMD9_EUMVA|nr:hypothetical protein EVAR_68059_1 [Eumeta japonica]